MAQTKLWLARWRNNSLHLYAGKPIKDDGYGEFWFMGGNITDEMMNLNCELFPEVTYENSPVEVTLTAEL